MQKRTSFLSTFRRTLIVSFMTLYLIMLTWIILFKANPATFYILFDADFRSISFIPAFNGMESLLNIAVFIPLGLFIHILFKSTPLWVKTVVISGVSLFYEALQYILCVGAADITDIMTNTLGGMIGLLFCLIFSRIEGKRFGRIFLWLLPCMATCLLLLAMIFLL